MMKRKMRKAPLPGRRRFLRASVATLASAGTAWRWAASTAAGQSRRRPNVLFVAVDDLNHSLGCYGHKLVSSPNIDRLAGRASRFERAYCQFPVCNPSRTSFLTGMRPDSTGVLDNVTPFRRLLPEVVTLPQLFRQAGYFTARLGKIFHGRAETDDPKAWETTFEGQTTERGRRGRGRNLTGGKVKWCRWLAAEGTDLDQPDGQLAAEAVRLLRQRRKDRQPFFLGLGFHKPHDPFVAPKKYFDLYRLGDLEPPREPADATPVHPLAFGSSWERSFAAFTDRDRREFMRAYYAGISFMDAQLGKVLDALAEFGLLEQTLIVLLGDHGYQLGEHGWWNKNALYEPSLRAPLLISQPGQARAQVCRGLVEFIDIYPTVAGLCGLEVPGSVQGRSLEPLLAEPGRPWREAAFSQVRRSNSAGRSVRTDRWRYIEWDRGAGGAELYDHRKDPGEYYNLVDEPALAEVRGRLSRLLRGDKA